MTVLHVYKGYPPMYGGIEGHLRRLARGLAHRHTFDVRVLVTGRGRRTTRERDGAVEVVRAGRLLELARTPLSWQLCRELALVAPDVTHLHVPYPMGELAQLLIGRSRHLVVTYHSDVIRQRALLPLYRPILRRVLQRADRVIVTSLRYAGGSPFLEPVRHKWTLIPHGVAAREFEVVDPARVAAVRKRWPGPLVLFVGRFRYYKGLSYLIEAAQSMRGTVLLVGNGPIAEEVRAQVYRLQLTERVGFAGDVDDESLPAYYAAADVFVLPSVERSEAFGIVQLEAMACGLPVVSTELGTGTSVVNRHGETGFVVPPRDSRALADAINRLLDDPALRARMGAAARARVASDFTEERMVDEVATLYRSLP